MAAFNSWLITAGFTNKHTEDLGAISMSKNKLFYDYFCYSFQCAGSNNFGRLIETSDEHREVCPHCKGRLFSKRSKVKRAEIAV